MRARCSRTSAWLMDALPPHIVPISEGLSDRLGLRPGQFVLMRVLVRSVLS
jgi:hypothetical protein